LKTISNIVTNELTPNPTVLELFDYKGFEWLGVFGTPNQLLTNSSPTLSLVPVGWVRSGVSSRLPVQPTPNPPKALYTLSLPAFGLGVGYILTDIIIDVTITDAVQVIDIILRKE